MYLGRNALLQLPDLMSDWYNAFRERAAQFWVKLNCLKITAILKQCHFNIYLALLNKYSRVQILLSVHMTRFAYMQGLSIGRVKKLHIDFTDNQKYL